MRTEGRQPDLLRYADAALAQAYRDAAETERRNPFFTPDEAERRASYYERQAQALEQPECLRNLTPEQKRRQASGNTSEKGRKGRAASPWGKHPHASGPNAQRAFERARRKQSTP